MSGSKADLVIRLEEAIRVTGQDPANARFYPVQSLDVTPTDNTGEQRFATATLVDIGAPQLTWLASVGSIAALTEQHTLADLQPGQSGLQSTMRHGEFVLIARQHHVNTPIAQTTANGICVKQKLASASSKYRPIRIGIGRYYHRANARHVPYAPPFASTSNFSELRRIAGVLNPATDSIT
ncbi:hypothetical protein QTP88_026838 [Uroleucon formosanum]